MARRMGPKEKSVLQVRALPLSFFLSLCKGSEPAANARLTNFLNGKKSFWALVSDPLPPPDAAQLAEDLGIEYDTPEHVELERGSLCAPTRASKRR
jgi:hypothetical protein